MVRSLPDFVAEKNIRLTLKLVVPKKLATIKKDASTRPVVSE